MKRVNNVKEFSDVDISLFKFREGYASLLDEETNLVYIFDEEGDVLISYPRPSLLERLRVWLGSTKEDVRIFMAQVPSYVNYYLDYLAYLLFG